MKKYLLLIASFILLPHFALAAIARDDAPVHHTSGSTNSYTVNNVTVTTTGDILMVTAMDNTNNGLDKITGITLDGVSMTQAGKVTSGCTSNTASTYSFYAPNVTAGSSHTLVASASSAITFEINTETYKGVNTSSPVDGTVGTACSNDVPKSVTPSATNANDWFFSTIGFWFAPPAAATNAVLVDGTTFVQGEFWDSNAVVGGTGTYTVTYTGVSGLHNFSVISYLLKPAAAVAIPSTSGILTFFDW